MGHDVFYACKAGIQGGIARCLNEEGHCGSHPAGGNWPKAPRPNIVLFKVKLNENQRSRFAEVETNFRTWSERQRLEGERAQNAEKLGRNAYTARPEQKGDEHKPEGADDGCPIYGKNTGGLKNVDVRGLVAELREAGFALNNVHVDAIGAGQKNCFLTVSFALGVEEYTEFEWGKFERLIECSFAYVHVWANARKSNGEVKHTVNCLTRQEGRKPNYVLHYDGGDWLEESVAAAVVNNPQIATAV